MTTPQKQDKKPPSRSESTTSGGWIQFLKLLFVTPFQWLIQLFRRDSLPPPPEKAAESQPKELAGPAGDGETTAPAPADEVADKPEPDKVTASPEVQPEAGSSADIEPAPPAPVPTPLPPATPETVAKAPADAEPEPQLSFVQRIRAGLNRGNSWLTTDITELFAAGIDEDVFEELETQLLMADVGVEATDSLIDTLRTRLSKQKDAGATEAVAILREEMGKLIAPCNQPLVIPEDHGGPFVILIVGVNGVGKTTTIGKLAHYFRQQGQSVMLAAGDTFRAAAVEQLQVWGERNDIPVVAQHTGADSASVIFDALESARARKIDVLIADTAGRLHTQGNLMDELKKVGRVMAKIDPTAPHETMLVVDGGTGQNALSQIKLFNEAVKLTGLTVTKLDGTAKGGVMFAMAKQAPLPIRFIGVGEAREDLGVFNADEFISTLFSSK